MSNRNKKIATDYTKAKNKKYLANMNALMDTKFSCFYVLVAFIEQIVLEVIGDELSKKEYDILGFISIISMFIAIVIYTRIIRSRLHEKKDYPEKYKYNDKLMEIVGALSYMSPLTCIATYMGKISICDMTWLKWIIIGLTVALGILLPLTIKKKKE